MFYKIQMTKKKKQEQRNVIYLINDCKTLLKVYYKEVMIGNRNKIK